MQASLLLGKSPNISHVTPELKFMVPKAGSNSAAIAEVAAFDAKSKPP
jgi:hypothetical protein